MGGLFKKYYPGKRRAHGANARPHGISRTDRNGLNGFVKQQETQRDTYKKGNRPAPVCKVFGKRQACSEAYFKQASYNQNQPIHIYKYGVLKKFGTVHCPPTTNNGWKQAVDRSPLTVDFQSMGF